MIRADIGKISFRAEECQEKLLEGTFCKIREPQAAGALHEAADDK